MNITTSKIVLKNLFSKPRTCALLVLFFTLYILFALLFQSFSLFSSLYTTGLSLVEKIQITPYLFESAYIGIPKSTRVLQGAIALLFALNLVLLTEKVDSMKGQNIKVGIGAGVISLAAAGCSACGISLLAVAGLTPALLTLPYHGTEILVVSVLVLTASLIYNFKALSLSCKIEKVRN